MSSHKTFPNQLGCKELPSPGFMLLFASLEILIDTSWSEPSLHVRIFLFLHYTAISVISLLVAFPTALNAVFAPSRHLIDTN